AFSSSGRTPEEQAAFDHWRGLLQLRKDHPALPRGRPTDPGATDTTYTYLREHESERLLVVLHLSAATATVTVKSDAIAPSGAVERLHGQGEAEVRDGQVVVTIPAESHGVFAWTNRPRTGRRIVPVRTSYRDTCNSLWTS